MDLLTEYIALLNRIANEERARAAQYDYEPEIRQQIYEYASGIRFAARKLQEWKEEDDCVFTHK